MEHFLFSYNEAIVQGSLAMKRGSRRGPLGRGRLMPVLLTLLFLSCGCANLKAIRAFSAVSAESAAYSAFTEDYVNTIERQKRYQSEGQLARLEAIIKERNAQRPGLLAIHKELCDYMNALGHLAADELVVFDESLNELAKEIKGIKDQSGYPAFKKESVDAFGALSRLLAKAATDAYRQKKLKDIIGSSNKDFQIVIGTLGEFFEIGYLESLAAERVAVEKYYRTVISTAEHQPPQQAAVELVKEIFYERKDAIDAKEKGAVTYLKILTKIAKGHQLLFDGRNKLSSDQLLATVRSYGNDISNLYSAVIALR